jgi:predicted outer membrane repeat protein
LNISSCLFDGNSAGDESAVSATKQAGGALYDTDGTVFLSDVIIRNNVGNGNGGGAAFTDSVVIMERSTFESSIANNGGAIAAVGGVHTYTDCVLHGNSAALASSQGSGGALYVSGGAEVRMERASCTSNTASASGGCTAMTGNFSFACLDCTISSNVASNMGGGLYLIRSYKSEGDILLTILGSNISSNQADSGAGVYCSLTPATFRDCEISHNSAESIGGGIYASGMDSFSIIRTLVNHNSAVKGEGGGIYMSQSSMVISNGTLDHNKASANSGGAVYLVGPSYATIANCSLNNNFASVGSVLAMEGGSIGQLLGVRVEHNAVSDSASISVISSRLDIWNSSILENTGGTKGKKLHQSHTSLTTCLFLCGLQEGLFCVPSLASAPFEERLLLETPLSQ